MSIISNGRHMKPAATKRTPVLSLPAITLISLFLSVLSGCGLAMDSDDRLDRGEKALASGDHRAAIIDAKDVLLKDPDNVRGRLLLGRASVEAGDGPAAEKEFGRAMDLGTDISDIAAELAGALLQQGKFQEVLDEIPLEGLPSSDAEARVRASHGDALMGLNRPEEARQMYSSVLEIDPENLDARLGIVSSFAAEGNFAQARGGLEQILDTNAENPRVWLYAGSFHGSIGDFESAAANFGVALELVEARDDTEARTGAMASMRRQALAGLAESLLEKREIDAARPYVDRLAKEAPNSLQTKSLVARVAFVDQDWKTAQKNLQEILQVAPNYRPAQVLLGAVHLQSGNLSQAEMYLSAAVAAAPGEIRTRQLLAETRLQLRRNEDAQAALEPLVSGPNADPVSLQLAARASLGRRDVDEALEYLRRNVAANPENAELRFQLAVILLQAGRTDEARSVLDDTNATGSEENAYRRDALSVLTTIREGNQARALEAARNVVDKYSDRSTAFSLFGAVQAANGDADGAKKSFARAIELEPGNMVALRSLGEIEESSGDLDSAKRRYQAALKDNPDAVWAMFGLGRVAFREQDFEGAVNNFRRAYEASPENVDFRLSLAKAEYRNGNVAVATSLLADDLEATLGNIPSAITLGVLRVQDKDIAGALEIATELQKRHPTEAAPYAFEGDVHVAGGDFVRADSAYDTAVSMAMLKRFVVRSYQIKRRLGVDGAERPLLDYLEVRPLDNEIRTLLAESYMQTDNISKSIAAYERVVEDEPGNAVALNNLAWSYYLVNDPRALQTATAARDAMPDNGSIVDTLGWIMIENGKLEAGEKLLRQAVKMENGRPDIRYHHAVALARLEKTEEARAVLTEILAGDTQFSNRNDAEKLLAEL